MGRINPLSLLLILLIVVCLFGTRRLRNLGSDIGSAVRDFRETLQRSSIETKRNDEDGPAA